VIVVIVTVWMYRSTSAVTAPPAIPVPAAVALSVPPSAPVVAQPVATPAPAIAKSESAGKNEPVAKQEVKAAKAIETPAQPKPRPVMEIAAAQPTPKFEPEAEMAAPKLVPAANDTAALAGLSKMHVAVPAPPKSELVAASLVSRVAPVYPGIARQMGIAGLVVMNVTIGPDGSVSSVRVTDGAMQLRGAAIDAVRHWRYKPATLNGKPVESSAQVQVNFTR
jgi:TonB family protein